MLTVLMATRNRAPVLKEVLTSYCQLQIPPGGWKLVVVDNGSVDETAKVAASFASNLPLEFLSEPKLGKNCALNTGIELAEGDLYVFTDDDAFPRRDWLVQLRKAADSHSEHTMFGGAIVPRWEISPPSWIKRLDLGPIFTITPTDLVEGDVPAHLAQGPNMAIRSDLFRSGVRFDPSIGPCGSNYAMGSELELVLRLAQKGLRTWHVQNAIVEHFVRREQLSEEWILQRAVRFGRGLQRITPYVKQVRSWRGIPLHLLRDMPKEWFIIAVSCLFLRRGELLRARWRLNILWGKAIEARKSNAADQGRNSSAPDQLKNSTLAPAATAASQSLSEHGEKS